MLEITDDILGELIYLESLTKNLLKRIDEIKQGCKEKGSFCTDKFVCTVLEQTRVGLVGLDEVKSVIDIEVLEQNSLIRVSTFKVVKVAPLPSKYYTFD